MKRHNSDWLKAFLKHNEPNQFPEKFIKWAGISAIAGALERKTWIYYRNAQVYPNLYIMLVGPPGSGKSKSANEAMKYLHNVADIHFTPNMVTQASLIQDLECAGINKAFKHKQNEFRMSAIFCFASEAVNTLGENYGSIIKILTDLYDCGHNGWHKDKSWHKSTKTNGDEKIFNPCINMLACTTVEWLTDFIDIKDLRGGFSSRNIFIYEGSYNTELVKWRDEDEESSGLDLGINSSLISDLKCIADLRGKFKVTDEVKQRAPLLEQEIAMDLQNDSSNKFNHFKVRKFWNILKVAQVLSASESSSMLVTWEHFQEAQELIENFMLDLPTLFGNVGRNKEAPILAEMEKWISEQDWFQQNQFVSRFQTEMKPRDLIDFWRNMVASGRLIYKNEKRKTLYKISVETPDPEET